MASVDGVAKPGWWLATGPRQSPLEQGALWELSPAATWLTAKLKLEGSYTLEQGREWNSSWWRGMQRPWKTCTISVDKPLLRCCGLFTSPCRQSEPLQDLFRTYYYPINPINQRWNRIKKQDWKDESGHLSKKLLNPMRGRMTVHKLSIIIGTYILVRYHLS